MQLLEEKWVLRFFFPDVKRFLILAVKIQHTVSCVFVFPIFFFSVFCPF